MKTRIQNKSNPIGIFDSGVGGLTVFNEIRKILPNEDLIYLGDTARVPYGNKSSDVVKKYARENTEFLLSKNVKTVVIACNTASAVSVLYLQEVFPNILIVNVIEPVVEFIKENTTIKRIGITGTNTTINSNAYQNALRNVNKNVEIFSKACPLFVPIVEEGLFEDEITDIVIKKYLSELKEKNIDALILGCTHYPMLKKPINKFFNGKVKVLDTAYHTAFKLKQILEDKEMLNNKEYGKDTFFVTDSPNLFKKTAELFLGFEINDIFFI